MAVNTCDVATSCKRSIVVMSTECRLICHLVLIMRCLHAKQSLLSRQVKPGVTNTWFSGFSTPVRTGPENLVFVVWRCWAVAERWPGVSIAPRWGRTAGRQHAPGFSVSPAFVCAFLRAFGLAGFASYWLSGLLSYPLALPLKCIALRHRLNIILL